MKTTTLQIEKHNNIVTAPNPLSSTPPLPPPALLPDPEPDRQRSFDLDSLKRKQRADSFFHSLTASQQDQLLQWFEEFDDVGTVYQRVTAPPPQGFGVKVHYTSLQRLRSFWRSLHHTHRNREVLDTIYDMETNADFSQSIRIQKAIAQMLHHKAFELARTHPGSDTVTHILSSIEKLASLDLKRQKLLLEREKILRQSPHAPKHHRVDLNIVRPSIPPDANNPDDNVPAQDCLPAAS